MDNNESQQNNTILPDIQKEVIEWNYDPNTIVSTTVKTIERFGVKIEVLVPNIGRPSVMTERVLELLFEAWSFGCQDEEACTFAGISPKTLYNFQKDKDDFLQYKEHLKNNPILKARLTLYEALNDPNYAWKYLQKKTTDLQDDPTKGGNINLNIQLNQLVEQDRKRDE